MRKVSQGGNGKGKGRGGKAKVYSEITNPDDTSSHKAASLQTLDSFHRIKIFRVVLLVSLVTVGVLSGALSYIILTRKR